MGASTWETAAVPGPWSIHAGTDKKEMGARGGDATAMGEDGGIVVSIPIRIVVSYDFMILP
jgi:hypothetical protein